MPGVMIIVVPLRAVFAVGGFARVEEAGAVVVVFQHQMNVTSGLGGEFPTAALNSCSIGISPSSAMALHGIQP